MRRKSKEQRSDRWINWDSWEAQNILINSDEAIYQRITKTLAGGGQDLAPFMVTGIKLVGDFYERAKIPRPHRVDFEKVNWRRVKQNIERHVQ